MRSPLSSHKPARIGDLQLALAPVSYHDRLRVYSCPRRTCPAIGSHDWRGGNETWCLYPERCIKVFVAIAANYSLTSSIGSVSITKHATYIVLFNIVHVNGSDPRDSPETKVKTDQFCKIKIRDNLHQKSRDDFARWWNFRALKKNQDADPVWVSEQDSGRVGGTCLLAEATGGEG